MDCHSSHWQRGAATQLLLRVEMVKTIVYGHTHRHARILFIGLVIVMDWNLLVYCAGVPARPRLPQIRSLVLAQFQKVGAGPHHWIQKLKSNMSAM
jgi:hypothetical protein